MEYATTSYHSKIFGVFFILAPLLFGTSTFFWKHGEYGVTGGTILTLSLVFWIPAFVALFDKLKREMPVYSSVGLLIAVYGCISGVNFGFVGIFSEALDISHEAYLNAAAKYPTSFNLILFWSGPLFPLSLLVLGIILVRKKAISLWTGVFICLGAIAFPLSRIPRIEMIAHLADLLLAIPFCFVGVKYLTTSRPSDSA